MATESTPERKKSEPTLTFSQRASRLREKLQLTQEAMANKLGIGRSYYGELENGNREPGDTLSILLDVMEAFLARSQALEKTNPETDLANLRAVENEPARYGRPVVAPWTPGPPLPSNPTREECQARLAQILEVAAQLPGGFAFAYSDLSATLADLRRRLNIHLETPP